MIVQTYTPGPPLSSFVACFWLQEGAPPAQERALPTGTVELILNLAGDDLRVFGKGGRVPGFDQPERFKGSMICGPHSEYFVVDSAENEVVLGVHFKPGGAYPFFRLPCSDMHNRLVPLEDLWHGRAECLRDELAHLRTAKERFLRLERFLLTQAAQPLATDLRLERAVEALQNGLAPGPIASLADDVGLSHRRFTALFRGRVGLTPKQYARVQRFQKALRFLDQGAASWADIAYACGFYDQPHLVHEFRALAGLTPTEYVRLRTDRLNHVFD